MEENRPLPDTFAPFFGDVAGGSVRGGYESRTGEVTFFDLENDPNEQVNLMRDAAYDGKFHELDTLLTVSIMNSVTEGNHDQRVDTSGLAMVPAFGHRGWQRTYPLPLDGTP